MFQLLSTAGGVPVVVPIMTTVWWKPALVVPDHRTSMASPTILLWRSGRSELAVRTKVQSSPTPLGLTRM